MPKGRITVTFDYDIDPKNYPSCTTTQEMVAFDALSYHEDLDHLIAALFDSEPTITGTVIED
ncbi:hypothetical protein WS89_04020 [Burkholderia sp. MSMB1072]|uniref:hypothetical protein n=1 Tax=Burkholderia sp. MSMB1072 TaxID=1637871 RepID=UPI00075C04CD|nr:hypothetical protein [Burkholderia sp. MSMB1072]KVH64458.1 hypothetical protein WS89_04020 [Burkholderia sp. MSMB1072]